MIAYLSFLNVLYFSFKISEGSDHPTIPSYSIKLINFKKIMLLSKHDC